MWWWNWWRGRRICKSWNRWDWSQEKRVSILLVKESSPLHLLIRALVGNAATLPSSSFSISSPSCKTIWTTPIRMTWTSFTVEWVLIPCLSYFLSSLSNLSFKKAPMMHAAMTSCQLEKRLPTGSTRHILLMQHSTFHVDAAVASNMKQPADYSAP